MKCGHAAHQSAFQSLEERINRSGTKELAAGSGTERLTPGNNAKISHNDFSRLRYVKAHRRGLLVISAKLSISLNNR